MRWAMGGPFACSRGYCVYTGDLIILSTNWKKKAGPGPDGLPGDCPLTDAKMGLI